MKKLFEPVSFGTLTIKNRFIRSATLENGCSENGVINSRLSEVYRRLVEGGIGLIITGMYGVCENSCSKEDMVKIYHSSFEKHFKSITEEVHNGGGKIVVQLGHCGVKSTVIDNGNSPYGPSDLPSVKAMTEKDIRDLAACYGRAALTCREAGADGVQIHGAHGYLISQFLSPYYNKRTDSYGGGIENRSRIVKEVYSEIRAAVGPNYPVLIKINYSDLVDHGLTGEECAYVCKMLEQVGIDGIEISAGIAVSKASSPTQIGRRQEGFYAEYALDIAGRIKTPVISVGGYRTLEAAEHFLNQGDIAAISVCRPLIREPGLPERWRSGDLRKSTCISCNKCFHVSPLGCGIPELAEV